MHFSSDFLPHLRDAQPVSSACTDWRAPVFCVCARAALPCAYHWQCPDAFGAPAPTYLELTVLHLTQRSK